MSCVCSEDTCSKEGRKLKPCLIMKLFFAFSKVEQNIGPWHPLVYRNDRPQGFQGKNHMILPHHLPTWQFSQNSHGKCKKKKKSWRERFFFVPLHSIRHFLHLLWIMQSTFATCQNNLLQSVPLSKISIITITKKKICNYQIHFFLNFNMAVNSHKMKLKGLISTEVNMLFKKKKYFLVEYSHSFVGKWSRILKRNVYIHTACITNFVSY